MIMKIVSSGHSGAAQAAIDVAVKMGIAYGGWTSMSHDEDLSAPTDLYDLKITESTGYREYTSKNIEYSNGTLIFSTGPLSLVGKYAEKTTEKMHKHLLVMDLNEKSGFSSSRQIAEWIIACNIRMLHITGMTEKDSPGIYNAVIKVLEASLFLSMIETDMHSDLKIKEADEREELYSTPPQTINQALDRLEKELSFKDKVAISNMDGRELPSLYATIGSYIEKRFMVFKGNDALYASCIDHLGIKHMDRKAISTIIIKELWHNLKKRYKIRVIKH